MNCFSFVEWHFTLGTGVLQQSKIHGAAAALVASPQHDCERRGKALCQREFVRAQLLRRLSLRVSTGYPDTNISIYSKILTAVIVKSQSASELPFPSSYPNAKSATWSVAFEIADEQSFSEYLQSRRPWVNACLNTAVNTMWWPMKFIIILWQVPLLFTVYYVNPSYLRLQLECLVWLRFCPFGLPSYRRGLAHAQFVL